MTAAEWLARAHAVTDGATSGPWEAVGPYIEAAGSEFAEVCMDVDGSDDERAPIDAAFIAASRTLLPAAVAAIETVLAELESHRDAEGTLLVSVPAGRILHAIYAHLDPS